jgi:uncharacterized linocin/CFP29 family protein
VDVLRRSGAPVSERVWRALDEAVVQAARHVMSARRVATFDGPRGFDYLAVPLGTVSVSNGPEGPARVGVPNLVPLAEIRAQFSLAWSAVDAFERGGPALDAGPAEHAAREVAVAEDRLVLLGSPLGTGFLGGKGALRRPTGDWRRAETIVADLIGGVEALDVAGVPGPYEALLAPAPYYALFQGAPDGGYPPHRRLRGILSGIHRSPALADGGGGAVFSTRGGDFVLTVGGDLATGYRSHDSDALHLFCVETVAAQTLTPEAVCLLGAGG